MSTEESPNERSKRLVEQARRWLAAGMELEQAQLAPCQCSYPDGRWKYVDSNRKPVHRCGRS